MATEKQIRANRENAKRSTGPKTLAGRLKSSRNALRHGLSIPVTADEPAVGLVQCLIAEGASDSQKLAAVEMARAQSQLQKVAAVRRGLLAELDLEYPSYDEVRRLAALERYECRAERQRRRATDLLRSVGCNRER